MLNSGCPLGGGEGASVLGVIAQFAEAEGNSWRLACYHLGEPEPGRKEAAHMYSALRKPVTALMLALAALLAIPAAASAARNVYVASYDGDSVGTFAVDLSSGVLSPSPALGTATGDEPQGAVLTADGKYLYVANSNDNDISGYAVAADGSLTSLGAPTTAGNTPTALTATADGKYLYAVNEGTGNIRGYAVASNGSLSELSGSPYAGSANASTRLQARRDQC